MGAIPVLGPLKSILNSNANSQEIRVTRVLPIEDCRLRIFENRILSRISGPKRDANAERRRLHNEEKYFRTLERMEQFEPKSAQILLSTHKGKCRHIATLVLLGAALWRGGKIFEYLIYEGSASRQSRRSQMVRVKMKRSRRLCTDLVTLILTMITVFSWLYDTWNCLISVIKCI